MAETSLPTQIQPLPITLKQVSLESNFFRPQLPRTSFCVYSVAFTPEVEYENRQLRGRLIHSVEATLTSRIGAFVMSGINIFAVERPDQEREMRLQIPEPEHTLILTRVRVINLGTSLGNKDAQLVLNILLKRAMRALGLVQLTRLPKFFDQKTVDRIDEFRLCVWKGWTMELNVYDQAPYACIDFASKVVHTSTVLDVIHECSHRGEPDQDAIRRALEGRTVIANYGNSRCYRIDEVMFDMNPTHKFHLAKTNTDVSYLTYFQSTYQKTLVDQRQPLLRNTDVRRDKTIFLVPELMSLTGLDDRMRSNRRVMQTLANSTRLRPNDRFTQSRRLAERIHGDPAARAVLAPFQVDIPPRPQTITAYRFAPDKVHDGENEIPIGDRGDFRLHSHIAKKEGLRRWAVMSDDWERGAQRIAEEIEDELKKLCAGEVSKYERLDFSGSRLERTFRDLASSETPPQIVVILLAQRSEAQRKAVYEDIKRVSIATHPIITQVAFLPLNDKNHRSIIEKLGLQIEAKIGATLWKVRPVDSFRKEPTMIVGIDTFHDTVNRQQSVMGFCATMDANFSRYHSTATFQAPGQEIGLTIGTMMTEALRAFKAKWNRYPQSIIVFRDGVAESQVSAVQEMEVQPLLRVCTGIAENYHPWITYTVVIKKTSAKFYTPGQELKNPAPGTLITDEVVPTKGDFYLIAHAPYQGIATPVLYRTVFTSRPERYPLQDLALLAFRLCHMYSNWTGAVKVPAPCMMAHKLAFLLGQSVHAVMQERLKPYSFYL